MRTDLPWNAPELREWQICGMNHYRIEGRRHLFVSMTRGHRCILAEGPDERHVFDTLIVQAGVLNHMFETAKQEDRADG